MNTLYFRFMRLVLGISLPFGILFLVAGFYFVVLTDKAKLAGELAAIGIVLVALATMIASHLDVAKRKILKRKAAEWASGGPSGTPIFSEESEYEAEAKRLRKSQDLMNIDEFGIKISREGLGKRD